MLLIHFIILFATSMLLVLAHGDNIGVTKTDVKREVSLSDIIQGALNFVRPIIRTSESMQSDLMASRKFQSEQIGGRDAEILGLPKHSTLDDMPICKSNSKICKFVTCTARNFQNDESIVNLNLAAQMLADTKLRKMIASDPSMVLMICQEQGLSPTQCKLFANAFQFIDRFISTIEPLETDIKKSQRYVIKDDPYYDDSDALPVPIQPGRYQTIGSQTWSVNGKNISNPDLLSQKLQLKEKQNLSGPSVLSHSVRSLLNPSNLPNLDNNKIMPIPADSILKQISSSTSAPLPTFPPLIFTFPTFATVAPMIFQPSPSAGLGLDVSLPMNLMTKEMQILMSHFNNNLLSSNIMSLPLPSLMLPEQFKPMNSAGLIRNKRSNDYYDNIEEESDKANSMGSSINHKINDSNQQISKLQKQARSRKGLLDCMKLLKES